MFERKKFDHHFEGRIPPARIVGNVYFVGCIPASSHLIDTGDGLILIDTGYEDTLFMLVDAIWRLGFSPADIKYILHTHWHGDHTAATRALVSLCGAKTIIGEKDAARVGRFFTPDLTVKDGDTVALGNTVIEIIETPGHTRGTISLFFTTREGGREYRVGMFGGAGANTLARGAFEYDECREDYRRSLSRLRDERVDVFIGNHVWNNDTEQKIKTLLETGENRFIDGALFYEFLDFCERRLDNICRREETAG